MQVPETRYACTDDGLHLAYQVFGDGPPCVFVPPLLSNVELAWDHELYRRALERLAEHLRIITFDKRGIGASDRFEAEPTLAQRTGDITAVMDAAGVERAHLWGLSEGGLMAQLFAACSPERADRMVLVNSAVGHQHGSVYTRAEAASVRAFFQELIETWGERPEVLVERMMPSQLGNAGFVRWIGRLQRLSANPADVARQVRSVLALHAPEDLGAVRAPTLVVQTEHDRVVPRRAGEHLAAHIPDATLHVCPGQDHFPWVDERWHELIDLAVGFLTGQHPPARGERRFAAVVLTDLVGSTHRSAEVGDASWREVLDRHDRICREVVDAFGGRVVKSTGDGLLATFPGAGEGVSAALELSQRLTEVGLPIRAGVHAGEVELRADGDITGFAVNLAARVEQQAADGTVWVSSTVRELLMGSGHRFEPRGEHQLKGIDEPWRLYEAVA